ncbi:MAG: NAD-binding protein [Candidatus Heimdallarchaeota archaeon]|nr:MAG: NAD-binding protein [Candidatus Heimdallarchaeota archaeon]
MVKVFLRSFLLAFSQLKVVLIILLITIISGTLIFQLFYHSSYDPQFSGDILDSIFATIALLLSMEVYTFPHEGELIIKLIYVVYPFLGLVLIGIGVIEFGMVAFTFRYRLHTWNEWLANTMENHTILVGLGNVGTRILRELADDEIQTTVITVESEKHTEILEQLLEDPNIAVIFGDASKDVILEQANVSKARALLAVTNDDLMNFKIASKAKGLNKELRTVIRAFDQDFAQKVTDLFDIDAAISTSAIAAPAFVATSFEDGIIQSLKSKKGDTEFHLMELTLDSQFEPIQVENFEELYKISILAIDKIAHPDSEDKVVPGSKLLLFGELQALRIIKKRFCS